VLIAVLVGLASPAPAETAPAPAPGTTVAAPVGSAGGPPFTGRPEPSMVQRVVDSVIWAWLLAVLVVGTGLWFWTGRRRDDHRDDAPGPEPPTARR
jgi:hypothetical protein